MNNMFDNPYKKYARHARQAGHANDPSNNPEQNMKNSENTQPISPLTDYKEDYKKEGQPITQPINTLNTLNTEQNNPHSNTIILPSSQHIKISVRLPKGIVTSLTIKKNIIALWLLYTSDPEYIDIDNINTLFNEIQKAQTIKEQVEIEKELKKTKDKINKLLTDFVYKCLDKWDKDSGKGLSDFVTEMLIEDFLDDYKLYVMVLTQL